MVLYFQDCCGYQFGFFQQDINNLQKKMQSDFVISVFKEGKMLNMEIKQKHNQVVKRKVKTWTNQQDNRLLDLYERFPKKWAEIAMLMTDRNQNQCLHRYRRLSKLGKSHKIWSAEEDETIMKLIKKYGKNWKLLSEMLGSKNGKQIRQRFINKLDPQIKREDWSDDEDRKILELYSKIGSKWSQISKFLPGRPENKIKNRFYSFIQKNFDIKFKEVDSTEQTNIVQCKPKLDFSLQRSIQTQKKAEQVSIAINRDCKQMREWKRVSQQRICSKYQVPSINQIDFQPKNDYMMSQNLLESILQVDLDWKEQVHNYQSIAEIQSCDLFFKFNS